MSKMHNFIFYSAELLHKIIFYLTRDKLARVVDTLSTPQAQDVSKRAHLALLDQQGPDAIAYVVNSLQ